MSFARVCASYSDMVNALRDRANELQISRDEIDRLAGFPDRYSAKILGASHCRSLGKVSMGPMLQVLGLKMLLVEDSGLTSWTIDRRTPRRDDQVHYRDAQNAA